MQNTSHYSDVILVTHLLHNTAPNAPETPTAEGHLCLLLCQLLLNGHALSRNRKQRRQLSFGVSQPLRVVIGHGHHFLAGLRHRHLQKVRQHANIVRTFHRLLHKLRLPALQCISDALRGGGDKTELQEKVLELLRGLLRHPRDQRLDGSVLVQRREPLWQAVGVVRVFADVDTVRLHKAHSGGQRVRVFPSLAENSVQLAIMAGLQEKLQRELQRTVHAAATSGGVASRGAQRRAVHRRAVQGVRRDGRHRHITGA
mmetsp:Transcript_43962/g.140899  ORF Transcript_43962/g.140899 Transcript_43962/m.140899 type:complete len:257 (-) Transcript_43962:170-940(-)